MWICTVIWIGSAMRITSTMCIACARVDVATRVNTIASNTFIWRNIATSNDTLLLVQHTLLRLEMVNFVRNLGLLSSDLVEVFLLDSLLLDSSLLLLEFQLNLFLLNFLQLSLNESIVDFTILVRLDFLEEVGLLIKFILASSLSSGVRWHVFLIDIVIVFQFLGQNLELLLRVAVMCSDKSLLSINAMSVTTNEAYGAFIIAAYGL